MTHERVKKKNKQRASEINLAVMLLCIVFFFLVCHFPRILLNVHEFFMLEDMISCGPGKCLILDRYTVLSNINVHKSSFDHCFWTSDHHFIDRF